MELNAHPQNKRKRPPNDLAQIRQRQLLKRRSTQSAAPQTTALGLPQPASVTSSTTTSPAVSSSFLALATRRPTPSSLHVPGNNSTLFGKPPQAPPGGLPQNKETSEPTSTIAAPLPCPVALLKPQRSVFLPNPFSNQGSETADSNVNPEDDGGKAKHPFQRFSSKPAPASPTEKNEDVDENSGEIGSHVESALARASRRRPLAEASAASVPCSYSCPSALFSPRVKVSKKPLRQPVPEHLHASLRFTDNGSDDSWDSDGVSDEDEDKYDDAHLRASPECMSDPEFDAEEREMMRRQQEMEGMNGAQANNRKKSKKKKKVKAKEPTEDLIQTSNAGIQEVEGRLMQLLSGKRAPRGDLTEQEVSAITSLSRPRKIVPLSLSKPGFQADVKPGRTASNAIDSSSINTELPSDWSLKTNLSLLSRRPFSGAAPLDTAAEANVLAGFVAQPEKDTIDDSIHSFLYHWAYPAERLPPAHVALMAKVLAKEDDSRATPLTETELLELKHFKKAQETWKQAFQSAYHMLRTNKLQYFYYINSEFSVLFFRKEAAELAYGACCAVMSSSTAGIRKRIEAEDIEFHVVKPIQSREKHQQQDEQEFPHEPKSIETQTASDGNEKISQPSQQLGDSPPSKRSVSDPQRQTYPLRFPDLASVHGLFEFLLKWTEPRTDRRAMQLPTLLALRPFLHAQLKSAQIVKNERVRYNIPSSSSTSSTNVSSQATATGPANTMTATMATTRTTTRVETMHKLVIDGYILPTALSRLLAVLRRTLVIADQFVSTQQKQDPGDGLLTGQLKPDETTIGINEAIREQADQPQAAMGNGKSRIATVKQVLLKGPSVAWK
ncbi:hypothetical protein DFJ77DRAFT_468329 [Powellomyces hirtus]|nr:hypothetical protein DFJ77DRAFT_468329 [Powellomyces hirtus]